MQEHCSVFGICFFVTRKNMRWSWQKCVAYGYPLLVGVSLNWFRHTWRRDRQKWMIVQFDGSWMPNGTDSVSNISTHDTEVMWDMIPWTLVFQNPPNTSNEEVFGQRLSQVGGPNICFTTSNRSYFKTMTLNIRKPRFLDLCPPSQFPTPPNKLHSGKLT